MQRLCLTKKWESDWKGRFADTEHYDQIVSEDTEVISPDGEVICFLKKAAHDPGVAATAFEVIRKDLRGSVKNRGTAAGAKMVRRKNQDGTLSKTREAFGYDKKATSDVLGFFERTQRFPFCRACGFNLNKPERWKLILPIAIEADRWLAELVPDKYKTQSEYVAKAHPDFIVPGTIFTTLTVNKNFRCAMHLDAGDLKAGFSAMSCFRKGRYSGGLLVFPEWRIAVHMDHGDLILFNPHYWHGNTAIKKIDDDAVRCTVVYYFREKVQHCLSNVEELELAKRRTGGPLFPGGEEE